MCLVCFVTKKQDEIHRGKRIRETKTDHSDSFMFFHFWTKFPIVFDISFAPSSEKEVFRKCCSWICVCVRVYLELDFGHLTGKM